MGTSNSVPRPLAAVLALAAGLVLIAPVTEPVLVMPASPPATAQPEPAPEVVAADAAVFVDMSAHGAGTVPSSATWQYVRGAEAFNKRLDARLLEILDGHAGGRHEPSDQDDAAATTAQDGLSITHNVVLATGSFVGSKLVQTTTGGGVRTGYTEEITYEDLTTGVVSSSAALINPEEVDTLRGLIREVPALAAPHRESSPASDNAGTPQPEPAPGTAPIADAELLSAVAFTPDGRAGITLSRNPDTGSALENPLFVTLSAEATGRVLSMDGLALRRQVVSGALFQVPAPSGVEHINCDLVACAALTYDDGPNAQTARLLEILQTHQVKATFFQQGAYVSSYPEVARSVAEAGHTIANHTLSHPYLTRLSTAGIVKEVQGAQAVIEEATGVVPAYLRPPYGATNASVAAFAGLPQILWDVDSLDWQSRNKTAFIPRIMDMVKPGSIILQHDVHAATVDGQDELITQLKSKGYYLVTLPQLFEGIELQPGGSYKCRGSAPGCIPGR